MRAKLFFVLCIACLSLGVSPARADEKADAGAFANDLGHKALAIITNATDSKDVKQQKLETLFQQNVDIDWIGKFVLGRFWRNATADQQSRYLANYRAFLVKHYTSNLSDYTDANFQVSRVSAGTNNDDIVRMNIKRPGADDIVMDYTVRPGDGGGMKVSDITVEGVSLITTQRSEFNSVVSQHGLEYLIAELARRSKTDPGAVSGN